MYLSLVDSVPYWRMVGVLLVEANVNDVHNTYKVEVLRVRKNDTSDCMTYSPFE